MGCKKKCKRCFQLPLLTAPFVVTGATGPVNVTTFVFPGKRCYKCPCNIQLQISAVSGAGSGTVSLVNLATGAVVSTAVVPASAPSTVTLTTNCCSFKCGPTQFAIQASSTGTFSFTIISVVNTCC